jgi:MerR family transcriptional regulator, light-induced transcriptional regulator
MSSDRLHNMKAVEVRTGLNAHLIRVWERRYGAVTPHRSETRRRLYTEAEVERLNLLGRLTRSGLTISQIANLPVAQLQAMEGRLAAESPPKPEASYPNADPGLLDDLKHQALAAIRHYDNGKLEQVLDHGMVALGYSGLLYKMLIPLLRSIGDAWEAGEITAAQEHGATAALKDYLARNVRSMSAPGTAPRLLVTTPTGQLHEMGAAIAASLAHKAGWNVTYLGPSLPAEEIAGAATFNRVRAVALSIIYPADDPGLPYQLRRLRRLLPDHMPLLVGGQAAASYHETLREIQAIVVNDMADFTQHLDQARLRGLSGAGT